VIERFERFERFNRSLKYERPIAKRSPTCSISTLTSGPFASFY
jgi:hypothetical protein